MHGWRITYLGADTPIRAVATVAARVKPARVVLASVDSGVFQRADGPIRDLGREAEVAIAGAGATRALADELDAEHVALDPVAGAAALA